MFVPDFIYFWKKNLFTYLLSMPEWKQKGVRKFYNSSIDAPKVLKSQFRVKKWLLRIITAFFLQKLDFVLNYSAEILKKVQKHDFFGFLGVAYFFRIRFSKNEAVIFFRFSLASKNCFPCFDWITQSWVIKFFSVAIYVMY